MDWKQFANWLKVAIVIEITVLFFFLKDRSAVDIITIAIGQYGLFFPVDLSIIINNIKGVKTDAKANP